jgi:hypothetical protein
LSVHKCIDCVLALLCRHLARGCLKCNVASNVRVYAAIIFISNDIVFEQYGRIITGSVLKRFRCELPLLCLPGSTGTRSVLRPLFRRTIVHNATGKEVKVSTGPVINPADLRPYPFSVPAPLTTL